jgi:uncharacterized iron-regulated membrane protein
MIRRYFIWQHRWAGLLMTGFLIVAGLTGTILAFDSEINQWLIPEMTHVPVQDRPQLDPFTLRERAQAILPHARFNLVPMNTAPGDIVFFFPEPRTNPATAKPHDLDCSGLYLNPYTGEEVARRTSKDGRPFLFTRKNFIFDVYTLHSSLCAGRTGYLLFGIVALIWTFDCFVGFYLTLPASSGRFWKRWGIAWWVKWRANSFRVNFDLHRAAGLWTWAMLLAFAISTVGFNLPQVYKPVMKRVFHMPDPTPLPTLPQQAPDPGLDWREAAAIGERLAAQQATLHGFKLKRARGEMYFMYDPSSGTFSYSAHGDRDVGYHYFAVTVVFDGRTGELRGSEFASGENAGITFTNWVSAIHTRTVGGVTMQILVGITGIVIAMLSVTGVYIWWKKRWVRKLTASSRRAADNKARNQRIPNPQEAGL